MITSVGREVEYKEGVEGPSPSTSTRGLKRRAKGAILWNTAYMHTRTLLTATLLTVSLAATGCGLLETNDDELETLRVEIIQLREDFMDLEAEVSLLARMPATTTTTASSSATTTGTSSSQPPPHIIAPAGAIDIDGAPLASLSEEMLSLASKSRDALVTALRDGQQGCAVTQDCAFTLVQCAMNKRLRLHSCRVHKTARLLL